jgi:hypothetical protein
MIHRRLISTRGALGLLAAAVLLAMSAGATPALADGVWWNLSSRSAPTNLPPGGEGEIIATATNFGYQEIKGETNLIRITDTLPSKLKAVSIEGGATDGVPNEPVPVPALCTTQKEVEEGHALTCTLPSHTIHEVPDNLSPYTVLRVVVHVKVEPGAQSGEENTVSVEGGETVENKPLAPASLQRPITVSEEPTPFGVEDYKLTPENEDGSTDRQAGSHPFQLTTALDFNQTFELDPNPSLHNFYPSTPALAKDLYVTVPPGLLANTRSLAQCSDLEFSTLLIGGSTLCPGDTAVGVSVVSINEPVALPALTEAVPVFNLAPAPGEPARFGFEIDFVEAVIDTSVLPSGEYAAVVSLHNIPQSVATLSSRVTLWGVPGDPRHDQSRGWECIDGGHFDTSFTPRRHCEPHDEPNAPAYLTLPTDCTKPFKTSVLGDSWAEPGRLLPDDRPAPGDPRWKEKKFTSPALEGCQKLPFNPTIEVTPTEHRASTPTGLKVTIKVPQETTLAAGGLAEDNIKQTTVALPEGILANPGLASGLQTCTPEQVGLEPGAEGTLQAQLENNQFSSEASSCPEAAKIGTVKIISPLLEHPLTGSAYLANQDTNPFASPLVVYLIAYDPHSGVRLKLAGEIQINAAGQITTVFKNTPPLPFETLEVELPNGERAVNTTPPRCGSYKTTTSFTPWSEEPGAPASPLNVSSEFEITEGAGGSPCPSGALPFAPGFQAGSTNRQAGAFTPFTLTIGHADGNQALESIDMKLPPGVAGLISQVTPCPEESALSEACGPESLIGRTTAVSGLGGKPVTLGGQVYLTGPLKATSAHGASPFGLSVVTHAAVGPFDLGNVRVLSTLNVDPTTAAVTVKSEPIPQYVKGVPSQLKQVNVTVERPGNQPFQFNPTNCNPMAVNGTLTGYEGASVAASSPFQVANCASLPFKPKLTAAAGGQASKPNGASLSVKVQSAGLGEANIAKVDLQLPKALPSRLTTIQKACVDAVFNVNPAACGEGSLIGKATVHTPVLKSPLTGPAYLVSHGGAAFPDVEFVLQGEGITLVLDGKTDIKKGITYSRFETAPDAPFTTFETDLPTGPHSALAAYVPVNAKYSLCGTRLAMPTEITGQNGAVVKQTTNVAVTGCHGVKAFKATRAQLLKKALKACKKKRNKSKRVACEKQARKKYGPKKSTKKTKKTKK